MRILSPDEKVLVDAPPVRTNSSAYRAADALDAPARFINKHLLGRDLGERFSRRTEEREKEAMDKERIEAGQ